MGAFRPQLPPKAGYIEVEVDGVRYYKNIESNIIEGLPIASIDDLVHTRIEENDNLCNQSILVGFDSDAKNNELKHYSFDSEHQINLTGMQFKIILATQTGITPELKWKNTEQDECDVWTVEEMQSLINDSIAFKEALITLHDKYQTQIKALTTVDEVNAFVLDYSNSSTLYRSDSE